MCASLTIIQGHHIRQGAVIRHAQICIQKGDILKVLICMCSRVQCTVWPEEGSSVTHLCSGWLRWGCMVSCTRS